MTTAVATCFMVVILPGSSKATNHATDPLRALAPASG
jgi:hypothetical protein